jgi:uncharacterized OB-fold protein
MDLPPVPFVRDGVDRVPPEGRVYVAERVWHPVHPALKSATPYQIVLVELPQAGGIRMVGNLLGDPLRPVPVGLKVTGVFEQREQAGRQYALLNWQRAEDN